MLELRRDFGLGMVTALIRIEGRPVGVIANNPTHLAGAIDSDGADKAARFMQLCDAFDIPILVLCDTPGIMVGPEVEKTGARAPLQPAVRHRRQPHRCPMFTIVLRKGYGLGAQAMAGGSFKAPFVVRRLADRRVRRHGPRGRGASSATATSSRRSTTRTRASALFDELVAAAVRARQGDQRRRRTSRSTTSSTRPTPGTVVASAFDSVPPPLPRDGKKRAVRRRLVTPDRCVGQVAGDNGAEPTPRGRSGARLRVNAR